MNNESMRILVLSEAFPFDANSESFFIPEMLRLRDGRSLAFAPQVVSGEPYDGMSDVVFHPRNWRLSLPLFKSLGVVLKSAAKDLFSLKSNKGTKPSSAAWAVIKETAQVLRRLGKIDWSLIREWEPSQIYSLWGRTEGICAIAIAECLKVKRVVIRHHNNDLYEERTPANFLPGIRFYLSSPITFPVFLCQEAEQYAISRFGATQSSVVPLAIELQAKQLARVASRTLRLVSISFESPVKRHGLLAEIICELDRRKISFSWTHIGESQLLSSLANNPIPPRKLDYKGSIANTEVRAQLQRGQYHFLVSTSAFEGLPFSMLEAVSAGIPSLGTNVGCVSSALGAEAVLPVNSTCNQWVDFIQSSVSRRDSIYGTQAKFVQGLSVTRTLPILLNLLDG